MRKLRRKRLGKTVFHLGHPIGYEYRIFVPSTQNVSKKVSKRVFSKRIRDNERVFAKLFGGATNVNATGAYLSRRGKLIQEKIGIVESFTNKKTYKKDRPKVISLARKDAKKYGQESILLESSTPSKHSVYFVK